MRFIEKCWGQLFTLLEQYSRVCLTSLARIKWFLFREEELFLLNTTHCFFIQYLNPDLARLSWSSFVYRWPCANRVWWSECFHVLPLLSLSMILVEVADYLTIFDSLFFRGCPVGLSCLSMQSKSHSIPFFVTISHDELGKVFHLLGSWILQIQRYRVVPLQGMRRERLTFLQETT